MKLPSHDSSYKSLETTKSPGFRWGPGEEDQLPMIRSLSILVVRRRGSGCVRLGEAARVPRR